MGKLYMEEADTRRVLMRSCIVQKFILSLNLTFKQYHRPCYSFERLTSDHTRSSISIKNVSIRKFLFLNRINAIGHLYHMTDLATIKRLYQM